MSKHFLYYRTEAKVLKKYGLVQVVRPGYLASYPDLPHYISEAEDMWYEGSDHDQVECDGRIGLFGLTLAEFFNKFLSERNQKE